MTKIVNRRRTPSRPAAQRGFLQAALIFAIILMIAIVAAWAASNRSGPTDASPEQARSYASGIITMGNNLKMAVDRFSEDNSVSTMTLDAAAGTGLYQPSLGIATPARIPAAAAATPSGGDLPFTLDTTNFTITGLGSGSPATTVVASGVSATVCAQINHILWNASPTAAIPSSAGANPEGCIQPTVGTYEYYKVVKVN